MYLKASAQPATNNFKTGLIGLFVILSLIPLAAYFAYAAGARNERADWCTKVYAETAVYLECIGGGTKK